MADIRVIPLVHGITYFPTVGKVGVEIFQRLEEGGRDFPTVGKIESGSSG